jgi:cell division protein FtsA
MALSGELDASTLIDDQTLLDIDVVRSPVDVPEDGIAEEPLADIAVDNATEPTLAGGVEVSALPTVRAIAAVDLGASKVACLIVESGGIDRANRTISPAGVGLTRSDGILRDTITSVDSVASSLSLAVDRAASASGINIDSVIVSTAGGRLSSESIVVEIPLRSRPIEDADLSRAIAAALTKVRLPSDRKPIHLLPMSWSVDGQKGINDPRSMVGHSLGLTLLVVTIAAAHFDTLAQCTLQAKLRLDGVVAAPFASALAALEADEMRLGAICIDMGAGTTSVAVFNNGALCHVDSLPVGGGHVTQDLARGLSTSQAGAERIKTLHGSAISSAREDREMIEAPPRGDDLSAGPVIAPRSMLKGIIAPRIEETFELVRERLRAAGVPIAPGAGIVLTGGASQLAGVREVATRVFDRPVRLGRPRRMTRLADAVTGPAFCAASGILHRVMFGSREAVSPTVLMRGAGKRRPTQLNPAARLAAWTRDRI